MSHEDNDIIFRRPLDSKSDTSDAERLNDAAHAASGCRANRTRGYSIQTFTGGRFFYSDPRIEEIDILDVAAGLSKVCRFNGQGLEWCSVAEHSVLTLRAARHRGYAMTLRDERLALLHDASEAYTGDQSKPMKLTVPEFSRLEHRIMRVIAQRFSFDWPPPEWLKLVDASVGHGEAVANMPDPNAFDGWSDSPFPVSNRFMSPYRAMVEFLREARACGVAFDV